MPRCLSVRLLSRSVPLASKAPKMTQVEVDEDHVKQKLGNIQVKLAKEAFQLYQILLYSFCKSS